MFSMGYEKHSVSSIPFGQCWCLPFFENTAVQNRGRLFTVLRLIEKLGGEDHGSDAVLVPRDTYSYALKSLSYSRHSRIDSLNIRTDRPGGRKF
mmetsp:Transcript_22248/g.89829  ORF Transcript_22248/g.89829 Transcript_22248/m.89829 type:complete len:94 (+) Transcript_22248:31-312(+)